jgi:type IV secretion system protein VirB8
VKLLSIVLNGGAPGMAPKGATVRFQRELYDKQSGATRPLDNKIATLSFTYKTNLDMDDQSRIENPLGFWVTDYRVDDDYSSAPPAEIQGTDSGAAVSRETPAAIAPAPDAAAVLPPAAATTTPAAPLAANQRVRPAAQAAGNSGTGAGRP